VPLEHFMITWEVVSQNLFHHAQLPRHSEANESMAKGVCLLFELFQTLGSFTEFLIL
jgi:hypothetical protein